MLRDVQLGRKRLGPPPPETNSVALDPDRLGRLDARTRAYVLRFSELHKRYGSALPEAELDKLLSLLIEG
jgi:hypothetical protein